MKKNLLWILASLMMACIGAGYSEEEHSGYYLRGDKLACNKGCHVIKYSPQEVKDLPEFLHAQEIEAYDDFFHGMVPLYGRAKSMEKGTIHTIIPLCRMALSLQRPGRFVNPQNMRTGQTLKLYGSIPSI